MMRWVQWLLTILLVTGGGPMITLAMDAHHVMTGIMVLLFALNPMCALYSGLFAGLHVRRRWWMPLVYVVLFVIGALLLWSMDVQGLYVYSPIYLVVGYVTMGITAAIVSRKSR